MQYTEYRFSGIPDTDTADIIVAELAELGFESFSDYDADSKSINCYITADELMTYSGFIKSYVSECGYQCFMTVMANDTNWNSEWESNFQPITVDDKCYLRATFHESRPEFEHEIVITPKMSFGTGHHATTHLVLSTMLRSDFTGKQGLDMGSGTGVLAILAVQMGAVHVDAVDIDEWAYENCIENIETNDVTDRITTIMGDASAIAGNHYDFILANINRNILLNDMAKYVATLNENGEIIFSGFLEIDINPILDKAKSLNLNHIETNKKDGWLSVRCKK